VRKIHNVLHMISQWFIRKSCSIVCYSQAIRGDQKRHGPAQHLFYLLSMHSYIVCQFPLLRQNEHFQQWKFSRPIYVLSWQTKTCQGCRWRTVYTFTKTFPLTLTESSILRWKMGHCSYTVWSEITSHNPLHWSVTKRDQLIALFVGPCWS